MKKVVNRMLVLCLACILLGACGRQQTAETETAAADSVSETTGDDSPAEAESDGGVQSGQEEETPQPAADPELKVEDLVGEQFVFEGMRGSEELGYTTDVIYIVPKLLTDGSAAKAINEDIYTFCLDVIEPTQDELDFPTWYNVGYEAYLNEDILSIVINKLCTMDDASSHATFNYNVREGSVVDNLTLIQSCGFTEASFVEQMRKAAAYESDENMQLLFDAEYWKGEDTSETERQLMYADHMMYRQNSISEDRINMQMAMYLDVAGDLRVFTEIDVPAGAGSYKTVLTPRRASRAKDFELSFEDSLFLTYQDGVMKVRMEKGDWTEAAFGGDGSYLEFGREYTVEGIYKDYIDGEMQFVFDGEYAVPVFVSDDGMVSALNLYACAPAGYFCMTEPVMGLRGIEAITEVNGHDIAVKVGETLIGQCAGFAKQALGIYGMQGFQKIYGNSGAEEGNGACGCYIGFDDQEEGKFLYQMNEFASGAYLCYTGECTLIGMNEEGLLFSSVVYADFLDPFDPEPHYSAFSLKRFSQWNDLKGDLEEWADFRELGGFITFNGAEGRMTLDITYG